MLICPAQSVLYSKWKVITSALLQPRYSTQSGHSAKAVAGAIAEVDFVLAPLVQRGADGAQRRRNLEMIFNRAASLGFLLFSQPGSYHFDFTEGGGGPTVFPGLQQVVDDQAHRINPPRVLLEKEGVADDGS